MPQYGCGHLYDALNWYGDALGDNELYKQVWDPMVWLSNAAMPALWFSWPQDAHFPMDSLAYSYHAAPGTRIVSLIPGLGHGHNWGTGDTYAFADSIVSNGTPWCVQDSITLIGYHQILKRDRLPLSVAVRQFVAGNAEQPGAHILDLCAVDQVAELIPDILKHILRVGVRVDAPPDKAEQAFPVVADCLNNMLLLRHHRVMMKNWG